MPKLDVPPTKTSLLSIKANLAVAREGYTLLDEKRQILVMELMGRLELARRTQREVTERFRELYAVLERAIVRSGAARLTAEAAGVQIAHNIQIVKNRVVGLDLPTVSVTVHEPGPQFGLSAHDAMSDEVLKRFSAILGVVARLAEVETAVVRLATELKKTQRRVNALEKIFIPDYEETLSYIMSSLEEREREGFIVMKMIKARRQAAG